MDSYAIDVKMIFSAFSFVLTSYFWLVKARKERPCLEFYQLSDFRLTTRRHPKRDGWKRVCISQLDTGGVLAVNHSTRQNSIILFDCYLQTDLGRVQGDWGFSGEDKPPWNLGPESTISLSPAFFFDVPEEYDPPESPEFSASFVTASGKRFSHRFSLEAPRLRSEECLDSPETVFGKAA